MVLHLALTEFDNSSVPVSVCDVFIFRTKRKQSHMENDTRIYSIWKNPVFADGVPVELFQLLSLFSTLWNKTKDI